MLEWDKFWSNWNKATDNYFYDFNMQIKFLVWSYIDYETSPSCIIITKDYEEMYSNSDNDTKKKEKDIDPYILDQMNRYHNQKDD
jgi:hypothetical protein